MPTPDILQHASGRWPDILVNLGGLSPEQLSNRHQPCPACGGEDRFRWDDDTGDGGWFCNQCGGKRHQGGGGNGLDLLMRVRGWTFTDACYHLEQHLALAFPAPFQSSETLIKKQKKLYKQPEKPPIDALAPPLDKGAIAQWCYENEKGEQLFWIQRISLSNGKKAFIHRVWLNDNWHRPSKKDPFTCEWPSPRPLYNLHEVATRDTDLILITEGEKASEAAKRLFPFYVATTWPNGGKAINHVDLKPLQNRHCILWPDNDKEGKESMAALAAKLHAIDCLVEIVPPPPDAPAKWDIADSNWSSEDAQAYLESNRRLVPSPTDANNETLSPDPDPSPAPFTCLGFDGDGYFYQPGATGQVIRISASGHTGLNLCRLAPLAYWEALFPGRSGVAWTAAASSLFTQQARVGVYDPDRIRGRGAWWDQGRSVLHLGDHLVVDGQRHDLTQGPLPRSRFLYQRLPAIEPLDATPLNDLEAFEILDLASRFSWEVQASGTLLAGWVALAPICGVLDWRPHAWLTAAPGSGKSEILKKYIDPLLGDISYWPLGSTTEANIRQSLRYDGIPVVYDESESEERSDKARVQSIIALARVASSSGRGVIGRGSADGHAQNFTMRSMFLLSSVSTALKHGADKTRFANLSLRNPSEIPQEQRSAHWKNLKADLERIITKQSGRRFQARIVNLIPVIRQSAIIFKTAAGEYFRNQRQGDQYGTLLAGAWALQSSKVPSALQAMDCLQGLDWEPYQQATEHSDELACLQTLLEHQLRIESRDGALTRTVAELVSIAARRSPSLQIEPGVAEDLLGRNGFRVDGDCLLISNTATAIARILSVTPWASCWAQTLSRVHGATRPGPSRFKGIGLCRCVGIPLSTVTV